MGVGRFRIGDMLFEYDEEKDSINRKKHGISLKNAALVFFDYDRIELFDEENSTEEDRFDTIGDAGVGAAVIGNLRMNAAPDKSVILFVVYTERQLIRSDGLEVEVTRLISARMATNFERGMYYGKFS